MCISYRRGNKLQLCILEYLCDVNIVPTWQSTESLYSRISVRREYRTGVAIVPTWQSTESLYSRVSFRRGNRTDAVSMDALFSSTVSVRLDRRFELWSVTGSVLSITHLINPLVTNQFRFETALLECHHYNASRLYASLLLNVNRTDRSLNALLKWVIMIKYKSQW